MKYTAFMPPADLRLSVFLTRGLTELETWAIGQEYVAQPLNKTLYGHAEFPVLSVTENGLQLDPDDAPPRHANVIGWPSEKSKQILLAQKLAGRATLHLREGTA